MIPIESDKQKQFLSLYDPVSVRLSRYIRSMVWNDEDARDIASETVLIAWQKFDRIRSGKVFLYYLFGIASRLIKQRTRRVKLWGLFIKERVREGEPVMHNSESTIDNEALRKAMERLSTKEKEAILLFEIAGLSLKEIREVQKDSISAVKSRLARGRLKLAKMLTDNDKVDITVSEKSESTIQPVYEILKSEIK
jgi:RNA polymerase sigma-70 factor (ECF subfamily)